MEITVDLGQIVFQHAILIVQELSSGNSFDVPLTQDYRFTQNYEVYIGNNEDYRKNQKCAGGPHMMTTDPNSYVEASPARTHPMWKYGKELWCNLEGQYMTIVADLSHRTGTVYEQSICSLGIMGAIYVRKTALPEQISIE